MSFKSSKKADLSLSTNAIVVMIIAIVILGLALTFTRTIFQKLGGQIGNLGEQSIEEPPTYDKPLTLTSTSLEIKKGQSKTLGIAVYNKFTQNELCVKGTEVPYCNMRMTVVMGECMGLINDISTNVGPVGYDYPVDIVGGNGMITMLSPAPKNILLNKYSSFTTKVQIAAGTPPGDYACTVWAIDTEPIDGFTFVIASQDIIVTVQ
jgi:hypothetical protein